MKRIKQILTLGGVALLSLAGCHARALSDGLSKETEAPELGIDTWVNGAPQPKGRPVVLEFWSKDCPPCRRNLPTIKKIAAEYGTDVEVVTVHVSLDLKNPAQNEAAVREFVEKAGIKYPVGIDGDGKLWKRFDFHYLPHMVLIGADGKVKWSGNIMVYNAEKKVRRAFGEPKTTVAAPEPIVALDPITEGECEGGVCAPR